jgi:hypothetical protein
MRINGLKSHDYHIWIEQLLPVMVRGYLPDHVWQVLAELSYFFRILCTKEISRPLVDPVWMWAHYKKATGTIDRDNRCFQNKAERVKAELWVSLSSILLNSSYSLDIFAILIVDHVVYM